MCETVGLQRSIAESGCASDQERCLRRRWPGVSAGLCHGRPATNQPGSLGNATCFTGYDLLSRSCNLASLRQPSRLGFASRRYHVVEVADSLFVGIVRRSLRLGLLDFVCSIKTALGQAYGFSIIC